MQLRSSLLPATALLALTSTGAFSQELSLALGPANIPNYAGLGIGGLPDYIGSDNYTGGAAPFGRLSLGGERYVSLEGNYLSMNLLDHPNWRVGPALLYRFGRFRHLATVLGLMPSSLLSTASEVCDRCIAALTACVVVAHP